MNEQNPIPLPLDLARDRRQQQNASSPERLMLADDPRGQANGEYDYSANDEYFQLRFWSALKTVIRWRWLIATFLLIGTVIAVAQILLQAPKYRAVSTLEVNAQESQIFEGAAVEPLTSTDDEFMDTQLNLLKSRSLAARVVDKLQLTDDENFVDQAEERQVRERLAITKIQDNLSVSILDRSRIIQIKYVSPSPREASRIATTFAEEFIEHDLDRKFNATSYARNFISERLQAAKIALEESDIKLLEFANKNRILNLDSDRTSVIENLPSAKALTELNTQLSDIKSQRLSLEVELKNVREGKFSNLGESEIMNQLQARRIEIVSEIDQISSIFNEDFDGVKLLVEQLEKLDEQIKEERNRLARDIVQRIETLNDTEETYATEIDEQRTSLQEVLNSNIDYEILSREVDTNRGLYEALLQRHKEVSVVDSIGKSRVSIVDRAVIPTESFEPNAIKIIAISLVLSALAGLGFAFAIDFIDDTIKTPDDLTSKLDIASLGSTPVVGPGSSITDMSLDPASKISEAMASIRMALQFSTADGAPQTIMLTSVRPEEGKTNTCASMGIALARLGKKVLIIDADMRKPSFLVGSKAAGGLSRVLTEDADILDEVVEGKVENLFLLPCTKASPNPTDLLAGYRFPQILEQAREIYDHIIIDVPPVMGFADAPTISSYCDATVMIFQSGAIRRPAAQKAIDRLLASKANIIGAIITKYDPKKLDLNYEYTDYYKADGEVTDGKKNRKVGIFIEEMSSV